MISKTGCLLFVVCVLFLFASLCKDLHAESYGNYLGWKGCQGCHEKPVGGWQKTKHAGAYESLKKSNQESLPECLRCHVTGYEETGGFIDFDLTPELAGVQCEECHGPGKEHAANPGKAGTIAARPGEDKCRKCHTPGQDRAFDYTKKVKSVHGR